MVHRLPPFTNVQANDNPNSTMSFKGYDPAIPDESRLPILIALPTPFFVLGLAAFAARIYARTQRRRLGTDDGFLAAGVICSIGYYIVYTLDVVHGGLGRHQQYLSIEKVSLHARYSIAIDDFYTWTVTFVKVSLACTLCRIQFQRRWRYSLFALIGVLFAFALCCSLMNWLQCRPLRAYWDFTLPRTDCLGLTFFRDWIYGETTFFMLTDIVLAALPIILILKVQMPLREKITVCILMGLGICASIAAIPKLINLQNLGDAIDWTWQSSLVDMFALLEMSLGILAVSNTANKALLDAFLRHIGLLSATTTASASNGAGYSSGTGFDDASTVLNSRLSQSTFGHKKAAASADLSDPHNYHHYKQHKRQFSQQSQQHQAEQRNESVDGPEAQIGFKSALDADFDLQSRPWYREH